MLRKDHLTPPPHLSAKAKELWNKLHSEYDLSDTAAILLEGAPAPLKRAASSRKRGGTCATVSGKSTRIQPAASSATPGRRWRDTHVVWRPPMPDWFVSASELTIVPQ